jgi:hypothetical protein
MALDNSVANKTNHYYYLYLSSITEQNQRPKAVRRSDESERRDGYRHSDMPRPQSRVQFHSDSDAQARTFVLREILYFGIDLRIQTQYQTLR